MYYHKIVENPRLDDQVWQGNNKHVNTSNKISILM